MTSDETTPTQETPVDTPMPDANNGTEAAPKMSKNAMKKAAKMKVRSQIICMILFIDITRTYGTEMCYL